MVTSKMSLVRWFVLRIWMNQNSMFFKFSKVINDDPVCRVQPYGRIHSGREMTPIELDFLVFSLKPINW